VVEIEAVGGDSYSKNRKKESKHFINVGS